MGKTDLPQTHQTSYPTTTSESQMSTADEALLQGFRAYYNKLNTSIVDAHSGPTDLNILQRLVDDLSEFTELAQEVRAKYPIP